MLLIIELQGEMCMWSGHTMFNRGTNNRTTGGDVYVVWSTMLLIIELHTERIPIRGSFRGGGAQGALPP